MSDCNDDRDLEVSLPVRSPAIARAQKPVDQGAALDVGRSRLDTTRISRSLSAGKDGVDR